MREDLKAYLDRELPALRRAIVTWHLSRCGACREEVAWLHRLGKNMRQLEDAYPRPELRARILASLPPMEPCTPQSLSPRRAARPTLRYALCGGALAVLLAAGAAAVRWNNAAYTSRAGVAQTTPTGPKPHIAASSDAGSSTTAAARPDVGPRDETSAQADKLTNQQLAAERRDARQKLGSQWKQAVAAVLAPPKQGKPAEVSHVEVAIAVNSVSQAHQRIIAWVGSAHAAVKTVEHPVESSTVEVVDLTITRNSSSGLYSRLESLGEITRIVSAASAATSTAPPQVQPNGASTNAPTPSRNGPQQAVAAPSEGHAAAQKPLTTRQSAPATIEIVIQLYSNAG